MNYKFPEIYHIDDVLPAIKDSPEFIVAERDGYKVINYVVAMNDSFPPVSDDDNYCEGCDRKYSEILEGCGSQRCPDFVNYAAIRRECRGIIFNSNGDLISRRLHKFFNLNERTETLLENVDFAKPHIILDKLDGSMITPILINGAVRWGTKMGLTDVAAPVEKFIADHPEFQYEKFARDYIADGFTPIFEWCSRKQRIVIDYPEDQLVLIAVRNNITGEYVSYTDMYWRSFEYGDDTIPVVKGYDGSIKNMETLLEKSKDLEGAEGWVVRFNDGHMLKVKGEWYVRIHKTKDNLNFEKNIVDMIITGKIDDVKSFMLNDDRIRVERFERKFWEGFNVVTAKIQVDLDNYKKLCNNDKRTFAIEHSKQADNASFIFKCWDGKTGVDDHALAMIQSHTGSQSKIDSVRYLWNNHKWNVESVDE